MTTALCGSDEADLTAAGASSKTNRGRLDRRLGVKNRSIVPVSVEDPNNFKYRSGMRIENEVRIHDRKPIPEGFYFGISWNGAASGEMGQARNRMFDALDEMLAGGPVMFANHVEEIAEVFFCRLRQDDLQGHYRSFLRSSLTTL